MSLRFFISFVLSVIFLTIALLFSCGKGQNKTGAQPKNHTITSKEIKKDTLVTGKDTISIRPDLPFSEKVNLFKEKYLGSYSEAEAEKSIVPERFDCKWKTKYALKKNAGKTENNVLPTVYFYFFEYADTISCRNTVTNWFNCYGPGCVPVKKSENIKSFKSVPSFAVINETSVAFVEFQCEQDENSRNGIISEIKELFGTKKSVYIETGCNSGLKWVIK